jgi:hypothetical protein
MDLQFKKLSARWELRELTAEYKMNRKGVCTMLLERYEKEGEKFLMHTVTGVKIGFTNLNLRVCGKASTGSTFRLQKRI